MVAVVAGSEAQGAGLQIRFYPEQTVRAYEVSALRGWNSLLLQNIIVVNDSSQKILLERVDVELMAEGVAVQSQHILGKELERAAKRGIGIQQAGLLKALNFQFRPDILLAGDVTLAESKELGPKSAVMLSYRYFVFAGPAYSIRVRAFGQTPAGAKIDGEGSVTISSFKSAVKYSFPIKGRCFIGTGQSLHQGHRWVVPEEFALDIARVGDGGLTFRGDSSKRTNYFAYGAEVLAAADGTVVAVQDGIAESDSSLRQAQESDAAYFQRTLAGQSELLAKGPLAAAGNYVVIQHAPSEFSFYAHLLPGSVKVAKGRQVRRGETIAQLGQSGNSTEPHLHFHLVDGPDPVFSCGLPVHFENVGLPLADGPREIQGGDIVEAH
jgi:murein DD-endopeptidase MepM/ murein hydrolase activator NlpD